MSDQNNRLIPGGPDTSLQINVVNQSGRVQIIFNKPISMLSITAEQALGMAMALLGQVGHTTWPKNPPAPQATPMPPPRTPTPPPKEE
jgi:hypothetical protein